MYSGIVEEIGRIERAEATEHGWTVAIACRIALDGAKVGDSIAVDGVCLTVAELDGACFTANIQPVTARLSTLGEKRAGALVNLERSVAVGERFGGHYVQGHVDGMGRIVDKRADDTSLIVEIAIPADLRRYVVERGFIAVDGASLTVMALERDRFAVSLVHYTQQHTTMAALPVGAAVNLEVDVIAKYAEQLIAPY
jgi:riboflavin synthase